MTVLVLSNGSKVEQRTVGPVSVASIETEAIERSVCAVHSICFYPDEAVHSTESWEGKVYPRRPWEIGAVGFIPAGSEMRSIPDRAYRETVIKFAPGTLERAAEGLVPMERLDLQFRDITDAAVFGHAQSVNGLALVPDITQWPLLVECSTLALAISIIKRLADPSAIIHTDQRYLLCDVRWRRVCEFVEANLHRRITLQEMADAALLSQYHFCRQFASRAGVSPLRFVLRRRVELAKLELLRPGATIAGVAYACGFGGQSHFTTTFRTVTGMTPGEYLRGHVL